MKIFFFAVFISFSALAQVSHKEFIRLNRDAKVQVINAYKEFFSEYKTELQAASRKSKILNFSFIDSAFASGDYNCFYAGWPSKRVTANGRSVCSSPARNNSSYPALAAGCSSGQLLCQPMLFGPGLCVGSSTQQERNMSFANCERRFAASGRTVQSVVETLSSPSLSTEADEIFQLVGEVCTSGAQATTAMCRNLERKVSAIKAAGFSVATGDSGETEVAPTIAVAPPQNQSPTQITAQAPIPTPRRAKPPRVPVRDNGRPVTSPVVRQEIVRAVDYAQSIEAVVTGATEVDCPDETNGRVLSYPPGSPQSRVACHRPSPSNAPAAMSPTELASFLEANNIILAYPGPEIANTEHFRNFVFEMRKFPPSLMSELKNAGASINLLIGTGVGLDPSYDVERMIATRSGQDSTFWDHTTYGRSWDQTPGSGGNVSLSAMRSPTRIAINQLYNNNSQSTGNHGSSNLFLHEHGHTLNSLYGTQSISGSNTWQNILNLPTTRAYMGRIMSNYENGSEEEGFAEMFAYFHSCSGASEQMQTEAPEAAAFFRNLTNVREFLDRDRSVVRSPASRQ